MTVVSYFSRAGENLVNGKLQKINEGNTKILAEKIARHIGCPLYAIEPVSPYPNDYGTVVKQAKREQAKRIYPELKKQPLVIADKEIIFLGFPNWWGTYPMPVARFLADHSLKDAVIYPFCTHEGSGFGSSIDDLREACPDTCIKKGLAVRGSRVIKADTAVKHWLDHEYYQQHRKE